MIIWRIHKTAETLSTNDDVKHAAAAGEAEGYVQWALKQTAGRGRQGRVWESPEGNLYCSVLLCPKTASVNIGQYSFIAALALCDTVKNILPSAIIELKWPNDVLVNGKKISGILLEAIEQGIVIGMGLNVTSYPPATLYPTTSLSASGAQQVDLAHTLDSLLAALKHWYQLFQRDGFTPIRATWLKNAAKGPMIVRLPHTTLQGTFGDLDINGNLRLHLADGSEQAIATGDVFLSSKD